MNDKSKYRRDLSNSDYKLVKLEPTEWGYIHDNLFKTSFWKIFEKELNSTHPELEFINTNGYKLKIPKNSCNGKSYLYAQEVINMLKYDELIKVVKDEL